MKAAIYCRVNRPDQTVEQQQSPLARYCEREGWQYEVFADKTSGAKESRPELDRLLDSMRAGNIDVILVAKLDRLGRSLKHLIQLVEEFNNKNIQFVCLTPQVDTKTAQGRFFVQVAGAFAELERELIRERTKDKLAYLKSQGQKLGRPKGSKDKEQRRKSGYWLRWSKKTSP